MKAGELCVRMSRDFDGAHEILKSLVIFSKLHVSSLGLSKIKQPYIQSFSKSAVPSYAWCQLLSLWLRYM